MNLKTLDRTQLIGLALLAVLVLGVGGLAIGRSVALREDDAATSVGVPGDNPRARMLRALTKELR